MEELVTVPNCRWKQITTIVVGKHTISWNSSQELDDNHMIDRR